MPDELCQLKAKLNDTWRIDVGTTAVIKLYKKTPLENGGKVAIQFHCQDTINYGDTNMYDEEFGNSDHVEEDTDKEEESSTTKFSLYVTRQGKTMKLSCTSQDAEISIDAVVVFDGGVADEDEGTHDLIYHGPEFEELDERMITGLNNFAMEECGVDEDVAAFISMYADYQEQVEYMNWLRDVQKIVG